MKILLIHNEYRSLGGENRAVNAQIESLKSKGHNVILFEKNNLDIDSYKFAQKASFIPKTFYSSETYNDIVDIIRLEKPNVAHIHNVFPLISPSAYYALSNESIPIVQTIHNFRFLCPNGLFYINNKVCEACKFGNTAYAVLNKCYRESYPLSALYAVTIGGHRINGAFELIDRYIALTEFTAQKLVDSHLTKRDKISVLGNFIPNPLPSVANFSDREEFVVFIGRISKEKGVDILTKAGLYIPNIKILIFGTGSELDNLRQYAQNHNLHNVKFLGHIDGEKKWDILRNAMAVIIPSLCYENFPMSALEGMSVGTPIVASRLGSLPFIIHEGINGLLFKPGDEIDLSDKIAILASQPNLRMKLGEFGLELFQREYSEHVHTRKLINIYRELIP